MAAYGEKPMAIDTRPGGWLHSMPVRVSRGRFSRYQPPSACRLKSLHNQRGRVDTGRGHSAPSRDVGRFIDAKARAG
jgi:hypothetical protein